MCGIKSSQWEQKKEIWAVEFSDGAYPPTSLLTSAPLSFWDEYVKTGTKYAKSPGLLIFGDFRKFPNLAEYKF